MNAPYEIAMEGAEPPHAVEMEHSVLGALMLDNDAIDSIGQLHSEHFFRVEHRTIFDAITHIVAEGRTADAITVLDRLQGLGKSQAIGGLAYLNTLVQQSPGASNTARYAQIVVNRWKARRILAVTDEIRSSVLNPKGAEIDTIVDAAQAKFEQLGDTRNSEPKRITAYLEELLHDLDEEYSGRAVTAVPTGYTDLDVRLDSGMAPGDLVIVAGRPSMGKTAFAMGIAEYVSRSAPVMVFSLEMEGKQLARRVLARNGAIPLGRLRDGRRLHDADWSSITDASRIATEMDLFIHDVSGVSLAQVRSHSRAIKRKHGLGLVVIDYLGLMEGGDGDTRSQQIGSITRGLKGLAKQLGCPIVLLAQLNRGLEQRPNRRPTMADLRDSGEIEQDADTILFIYRDEVYNQDSADRGIAEIIIGKQRNGAIGRVGLAYTDNLTRFDDLAAGTLFGETPVRRVRVGGFEE